MTISINRKAVSFLPKTDKLLLSRIQGSSSNRDRFIVLSHTRTLLFFPIFVRFCRPFYRVRELFDDSLRHDISENFGWNGCTTDCLVIHHVAFPLIIFVLGTKNVEWVETSISTKLVVTWVVRFSLISQSFHELFRLLALFELGSRGSLSGSPCFQCFHGYFMG
jgi:hypothetical protein